jgi:phosphatidylinositol-3-phosphatase
MGNFRRLAAAFVLLLPAWAVADGLPRYEHIVVVVEENKDYDEIIGNPAAPYLNRLAAEGIDFTQMFGEEHPSEGNYFWLFAGSNLGVGFHDEVPTRKFDAANLGAQLIANGLTFRGYSQSLPEDGSEVEKAPPGCLWECLYGRKHVPWISFATVPPAANLRFAEFPADYRELPNVSFVIPDLEHDMHNGAPAESIPRGDSWLRDNLDAYYRWAQTHNSLLIVTFDEGEDSSRYRGLTDPGLPRGGDRVRRDLRNQIPTIFAGANLGPRHAVATPLTHVNILRTIEAIYGLPKAGAQQPLARRAGIGDEAIAGIFAQ